MSINKNRTRILIADDEPENIWPLIEELEKDFEVLCVTNGRDALDIAFSEPFPDLILLDIMMPDINGYEILSRLKADEATKRIPVIFITAKTEELEEAKGIELGAQDYITKPFSLAIARARINSILNYKKEEDRRLLLKGQLEDMNAQLQFQVRQKMKELDEAREALQRYEHRYSKLFQEDRVEKAETILVVDDNPENIQILIENLENQYEIICTTSGEDALEIAFSENQPDLILLDIIMPGMDGYEICSRLKANPDTLHIPVIFITSLGEEVDETKGLNLGGVDFITKPFNINVLQARITAALRLKQEMSARMHLTRKLADLNKNLEYEINKKTFELKEAHENLKLSERKYRSIYQNAIEGIFQTTPDGRLISASPSLAKIFGYESDREMVGSITDVTHQLYCNTEDRKYVKRELEEKGEITGFETRFKKKNGDCLWGMLSSKAIKDETEANLYYQGFLVDITERKRAENAIRESENRYRSIMEASPDPIVTYDMQGNATYINPAFSRVFGWTSEEVVGKKIDYVLEEARAETRTMLDKLNRGESFLGFQTRRYDKDRNIIDIEMSFGVWKTDSGVPAGSVIILRDVTERIKTEKMLEESESLYRLTLSNVHDTVFLTDEYGNFTFVCPNTHFTTGYSDKEVLAIGNINELIGNLHVDYNILNKKGSLQNIETEILSKSGSKRSVLVGIKTINFKNSSLLYTIHDITEIKEIQNRLNQAQKLEAIGTLAGGIAHDFNNILMGIMGFAELALIHLKKPEKVKYFICEVIKNARKSAQLVQQIQAVSRKSVHRKQPVSVYVVVKEALKMLRATLPATIEINEIIASKAKVMADSVKIHQVIMNLGINAYHAMSEEGGALTVSLNDVVFSNRKYVAEPYLAPGKYLKISVGDTGHGMDSNTLKKIFDPYFTTKKPGKGTGLGLAVVLGITEEHGGVVRVYSELGEGSTFHVYLPISEGAVASRIEEDKKEDPASGSEKILLVDDDAAVLGSMQEILKELGYEVYPCPTGTKAFAIYMDNPYQFDLVITDMTMPGISGYELARKIFELRPDQPVILCTGLCDSIIREKAISIGIKGFFEKPMNIWEFARMIRNVLDKAM